MQMRGDQGQRTAADLFCLECERHCAAVRAGRIVRLRMGRGAVCLARRDRRVCTRERVPIPTGRARCCPVSPAAARTQRKLAATIHGYARRMRSVGSYAFITADERIERLIPSARFGGACADELPHEHREVMHAHLRRPACQAARQYAAKLDVRFDEHARLLFPEYVELEDLSPAHIFSGAFTGCRLLPPDAL